MHLPVSNHGNILQLSLFCVDLERVDGITVLGKLGWSIGRKQLSINFTSVEAQLVTANACGCHMYIISW